MGFQVSYNFDEIKGQITVGEVICFMLKFQFKKEKNFIHFL